MGWKLGTPGGYMAEAQAGDGPSLVSVVIPTRNEAEDIRRTLEACLAMAYEPKEIIVVDDSDDETPLIVSEYAGQGVTLIRRAVNRNGCCGARNLGMRKARGEIVVLVNGDNVPHPKFLCRLLRLYEQGADYVVVRSVVKDQSACWARLIEASGLSYMREGNSVPEWSEGFSCRRSAAASVGYIPGDFPVPFCRDWMLGANLKTAGFRQVVDLSIEMPHIAPSTFNSFWRNQVWRGTMWAPSAFYFRHMALSTILAREGLKAVRTALVNALLLPRLVRAWRYGALLGVRRVDCLALWWAGVIQDAALAVGAFRGWRRMARAERANVSGSDGAVGTGPT